MLLCVFCGLNLLVLVKHTRSILIEHLEGIKQSLLGVGSYKHNHSSYTREQTKYLKERWGSITWVFTRDTPCGWKLLAWGWHDASLGDVSSERPINCHETVTTNRVEDRDSQIQEKKINYKSFKGSKEKSCFWLITFQKIHTLLNGHNRRRG